MTMAEVASPPLPGPCVQRPLTRTGSASGAASEQTPEALPSPGEWPPQSTWQAGATQGLSHGHAGAPDSACSM